MFRHFAVDSYCIASALGGWHRCNSLSLSLSLSLSNLPESPMPSIPHPRSSPICVLLSQRMCNPTETKENCMCTGQVQATWKFPQSFAVQFNPLASTQPFSLLITEGHITCTAPEIARDRKPTLAFKWVPPLLGRAYACGYDSGWRVLCCGDNGGIDLGPQVARHDLSHNGQWVGVLVNHPVNASRDRHVHAHLLGQLVCRPGQGMNSQ